MVNKKGDESSSEEEGNWEVLRVLNERVKNGERFFFVKWKDDAKNKWSDDQYDSWINEEDCVLRVLVIRVVNGKREFYVKWKDDAKNKWSEDQYDDWIEEGNCDIPELIKEYEEEQERKKEEKRREEEKVKEKERKERKEKEEAKKKKQMKEKEKRGESPRKKQTSSSEKDVFDFDSTDATDLFSGLRTVKSEIGLSPPKKPKVDKPPKKKKKKLDKGKGDASAATQLLRKTTVADDVHDNLDPTPLFGSAGLDDHIVVKEEPQSYQPFSQKKSTTIRHASVSEEDDQLFDNGLSPELDEHVSIDEVHKPISTDQERVAQANRDSTSTSRLSSEGRDTPPQPRRKLFEGFRLPKPPNRTIPTPSADSAKETPQSKAEPLKKQGKDGRRRLEKRSDHGYTKDLKGKIICRFAGERKGKTVRTLFCVHFPVINEVQLIDEKEVKKWDLDGWTAYMFENNEPGMEDGLPALFSQCDMTKS